jgi:hypothetical protein
LEKIRVRIGADHRLRGSDSLLVSCMPRRLAAFSPREKVSEGRMRGKRPWQTRVHRIAEAALPIFILSAFICVHLRSKIAKRQSKNFNQIKPN